MGRDRRIGTPWVLATMVVTLVSRWLWISDMEYKYDEALTVRQLAHLAWKTWTPLAPVVSEHSGTTHSSGFFYLLFGLIPNKEPLTIATTIALLNAISIIVPLWCLRRTPKYFYTFALCATSLTLIVGSRKIWTPDLQAAWVCASIALIGASAARSKLRSLPLAALGAFCLVMAGHMYLPAVFVAAVGGLAVLIAYGVASRWLQFAGWTIGSAAGWSTFIPWALALLSRAPGAHAHAKTVPLGVAQFMDAARMGFTIHTPYSVYALYLEPQKGWMNEHASSSVWLKSTLLWINVSCAMGGILFVASVFMALRRRHEVVRDPLLLTACGLLLAMPIALFVAQLGTYIHYWLAAVPFFYYWIAWTATRGGAVWRWLAVATCVTSWLAASSFAGLVHDNKGLPGEYGTAFSARG